MKNFDTRTYSISDFIEWDKTGLLELSPDFQRRSVWTEKAKSYLIDTILRGKPMPKIIITQRLEGAKNVRVVVDGQQRLRAILEYYNGDFRISRAHNKELSKFRYETLPDGLEKEFLKYELGVDLLFDVPYEEILDIFARINSYTVKLVDQELYNAVYLGFFKQAVYRLGYRYVKYFIESGVLTKVNVTRMAEAQLAADLFVSLIDGVQTNKNIEAFYKRFEDEQDGLEEKESYFDTTMSYIGAIYSAQELSKTNWSRAQLFYTLFTSIGHLLFRLDGLKEKFTTQISEKSIGRIRIVLDEISSNFDKISENMEEPSYSSDYKNFINQSRRGTTDTVARVNRANFVCEKITNALS